MTKTDMILKEVTQLRWDMSRAVTRIAALEETNALLAGQANTRGETADAQATYTAMMTDTLLEV